MLKNHNLQCSILMFFYKPDYLIKQKINVTDIKNETYHMTKCSTGNRVINNSAIIKSFYLIDIITNLFDSILNTSKIKITYEGELQRQHENENMIEEEEELQ